jgi:predicted RNA-binding protein with PUA-like domain
MHSRQPTMKQPKKRPEATTSARRYWLLKSDAETFSFADLLAAPKRRTGWDGVRNHQAKLYLRDQMKVGDGVLFYHSSAEPPGVAGVARVARAGHPDPTQFEKGSDHFDPKSRPSDPTWFQVEIKAVAAMPRFVTLEELRARPELSGMLLLRRGQRLSVLPVAPAEWKAILALGGLDPARAG